jgi:hypothetical protein
MRGEDTWDTKRETGQSGYTDHTLAHGARPIRACHTDNAAGASNGPCSSGRDDAPILDLATQVSEYLAYTAASDGDLETSNHLTPTRQSRGEVVVPDRQSRLHLSCCQSARRILGVQGFTCGAGCRDLALAAYVDISKSV